MKIGYIYNFHAYPPRGGGHRHAYELTQGFLKRKHKVCVIEDPSMPGAINYTHEQIDDFLGEIDILYLRIDGVPLSQRRYVLTLLEQSSDIPTVWEINAPADERLAFSWLGGKKDTKKDTYLIRIKRWLHAARQIPKINTEIKLLKKLSAEVNAAICLSNPLRDYAENTLHIKNVNVIPMAGPLLSKAHIASRKTTSNRTKFRVLYSGSADYPWLGLGYLCEAVALAQSQSIKDIEFYFIVPKVSQYLPTGPLVSILEGLSFDEIINETIRADVGVAMYPEYVWVKRGLHNSPTKIFEYMACQCPVITSNHSQMKDIIQDNYDGFLIENSSRQLLQTILECKNDRDNLRVMGLHAWEKIQNDYNWPQVVNKTLEVFSEAINPGVE